MNRLYRVLSMIIVFAILFNPLSMLAEDILKIPSGVTCIESGAFDGDTQITNVFLPESVTDIAADAFPNPETLTVFGFPGSAAEAYAESVGAAFVSVSMQGATLSAPAWASPYREVLFEVAGAMFEDATYAYTIYKDGEAYFESGETSAAAFPYIFREGGVYTAAVAIKNEFGEGTVPLLDPITIAEPIRTEKDRYYLQPDESCAPISEEETREVVLTCEDEGLSISGRVITANALGKYTVTASAETPEGTVYTDIPFEVIIAPSEIIITAEKANVLEGGTLQLYAEVLPENATYKDVSWHTDNEEIATVDESGLLTAISQGAATIYAQSADTQGTFRVRVDKAVSTIRVFPVDAPEIIYTGMSFTLDTAASPETATDPTVNFLSLTSLAEVDAFTGKVTALKAGEALISAIANDGGGARGEYTFVIRQGVDSITFTDLEKTINPNERYTLPYVLFPVDAENRNVSFSSSDEAVATVSSDGVVTGVSSGTCTILVSASNGVTAELPLTVAVPVTHIDTALTTLYLNTGMTANPIGNFVFVKPLNATDPSLSWKSSNTSVAKVNAATGQITAVSAGTATITGTASSGARVSFSVKVVTDASVIKSINFPMTYGVITVGSSTSLTPSASPVTKYASGTWYCEDTSILEIVSINSSNTCTVRGASPGVTNLYIIASSGVSLKLPVVVNPIAVTALKMNASAISLNIGDSFPLAASHQPSSASAANLKWTSSNPSVVTVDRNGLVSAVSSGSAVITASIDEGITVSATCSVTVNALKMTSASLAEEASSVENAGTSRMIEYTYLPENASPARFVWSSDNPSVAQVDALTGLASFVLPGEAVITATAIDGSGLTLTKRVTVTETPITAFRLSADRLTLTIGDAEQLCWRVAPADASYAVPVFASGDTGVVDVSASGLVKAVSQGETVICASVGTGDYVFSLEIPVTVLPKNEVTYRALIAGQFSVSGYDGYLPFANNGTAAIADALSRSVIEGKKYEITRLRGNPVPASIFAALQTLANKADENDVTVFFFLTHGALAADGSYFMDTSSGSGILPSEMINALKRISGHVVFILCTCNSGDLLDTSAARSLYASGGVYQGTHGEGRLSILCSASNTLSSYYNVKDEKQSFDFYTYALSRGLGWDMLSDTSMSMLADANGDRKVTIGELAPYSRVATQGAISSYLQMNGSKLFHGSAYQFPRWQFATGESDLVIIGK